MIKSGNRSYDGGDETDAYYYTTTSGVYIKHSSYQREYSMHHQPRGNVRMFKAEILVEDTVRPTKHTRLSSCWLISLYTSVGSLDEGKNIVNQQRMRIRARRPMY